MALYKFNNNRQWAELQRVRKGVKKDVDQRATKGRKTRLEWWL